MWEINITEQVSSFGLSLFLGALLCLVYDFLRALRRVGFNSYWAVFFTDILFCVFSAFVTFIFLISRTNGEIRGYILLGTLLGFIICRITVSKVVFMLLYLVLEKISFMLRLVNKYFLLFYSKIEAALIKNISNILKKFKTAAKSIKKLLKNSDKLLYTNSNNVNMESIVDESKTGKRRSKKTAKTKTG